MEFQIEEGIAILERAPATFRALLDGLPDTLTTPNEGPDTLSAYDNVGHLIHGERTDWIPRARISSRRGSNRRFEPYNRFARARESEGKRLTVLLDQFTQLRQDNVATLRSWNLSERELALEGELRGSVPSHCVSGWPNGWSPTLTIFPHGRTMARQDQDAVGGFVTPRRCRIARRRPHD